MYTPKIIKISIKKYQFGIHLQRLLLNLDSLVLSCCPLFILFAGHLTVMSIEMTKTRLEALCVVVKSY